MKRRDLELVLVRDAMSWTRREMRRNGIVSEVVGIPIGFPSYSSYLPTAIFQTLMI